jgi:SAM-dependent methyltransferase
MTDVTDYGTQFADIYDDLIPRTSFTDEMGRWVLGLVEQRTPSVLELGVGTGRVLVPLARVLRARGSTAPLVGVDASPEMLDRLEHAASGLDVDAVVADIRSFRSEQRFDLVLCVCNTIGMSIDPGSEAEVFRTAAAALRPGGVLVVETQNAELVRGFFGPDGPGVVFAPYPGRKRGLVSFGTIVDDVFRADQVWIDGDSVVRRNESVRLADVADLVEWADAAGLHLDGHSTDLSGQPAGRPSVHDVLVFRAH